MQIYLTRCLTRLALALILGVIHSASFAPLEAWYLQFCTLGGLYLLLRPVRTEQSGAPPQPAAWLIGLTFGLGWFLSGVSWIFISLHTYGQMAFWIAAPATLFFCLYLSVFPAVFAGGWQRYVTHHSSAQTPSWQRYLLFGAAWAASEWLRGSLFTGFPWLSSGYAHTVSPLAGYAPIVGVYGLAWLSASLAAVLASTVADWHGSAWTALRWRHVTVVATVLLVGSLLHHFPWTSAIGKPISVRLLQGGIPQDTKFRIDRLYTALATYFNLIEEKPAALIVLPETAFPLFWQELPVEYQRRLQRAANVYGSHIITGMPLEEPLGHYTNSVVMFAPGGKTEEVRFSGRYDKHHLVPFGEFVPWGFRWFVDLMEMPLGDFGRGALQQAPFTVGEQRVAPNICYEDLFGEELRISARAATLLLNLSNLAWFGDSYALPQHLQISQMRALEMRKPMLRATNTGMTAIIQANGEVSQQLIPFATAAAEGEIQGRTGYTPYAWWGNWPLLLGCLALFGKRLHQIIRGRDQG